tara:strand:+ start:31108 stop:32901 length:1794 start_codon:yes stop_codon:yes gene_type:complete
MAKVFSVEQLRLNDRLLTGSAEGLFIDGQQLAVGSSAVPLARKVYAGDGLKISNGSEGPGWASMSADLTLDVDLPSAGSSALEINLSDQLIVKDQGITKDHLSTNAWGLGLAGGGGNAVDVGAGSGLSVQDNHVDIDVSGVTNEMLYGGISDGKLNTITAGGKVAGSAVQLNSVSNTVVNDGGLKVNDASITKDHLNLDVAGDGLLGGAGNALYVGAGSGIHIQAGDDNVNIGEGGVVNTMLAGGITQDKLNTISTYGKVEGSAVTLHDKDGSSQSISDDNGLEVKAASLTSSHLSDSNLLGAGLNGGNGTDIYVGAGSGMHVEGGQVHINNTGITAGKIADGAVTNAKVNTNELDVAKTKLTAGNGLTLSTNTLDVVGGTGILVNANDINVDTNVVRTDASATQILEGNYTFNEQLLLLSGITIGGDLTVRGQTVITEQNQVNIGDNIIVLNSDYLGSSPPDAGFEVERDGATYGNASLIFDDDTSASSGGDVWKAGFKGSEHMIHTAKTMRTYEKIIASGVTKESVLFGYTFPDVPNVVVSIQNTATEVEPSRDPDLFASMVTAVNTTGFNVEFSGPVDGNNYYIKAFVEGGAIY